MIKNNIIIKMAFFMTCLLLTSCARPASTVSTFVENKVPSYQTAITESSEMFVTCIIPKMESYEILIGLPFEDLTLPVDYRPAAGGVDLYQKNNGIMLTYVKVRGSDVSLFLNDTLSKDRLRTEISTLIDSCK